MAAPLDSAKRRLLCTVLVIAIVSWPQPSDLGEAEVRPFIDAVPDVNGARAPAVWVVVLAPDGRSDGARQSARCVRSSGTNSADCGRALGQRADVRSLTIHMWDTSGGHRTHWAASFSFEEAEGIVLYAISRATVRFASRAEVRA